MSLSSPEKMTSSQQKLKMQMLSIDTWSTREQLCLASSVLRSGDQNWVSVSRSLKSFAEPNRPPDWLSPKNCALQYNSLLEKTGAHKRKRGERHPSSGSTDSQGETAGEIILRQLTQERIEELQELLETSRKEYDALKKELALVEEGKLDDKLGEICKRIDEENERKLKEQAAHLKWLEERELKQQEMKKVQQILLRSPSKTSNQVIEVAETEIAANSPSVTDQLNIDVSSEEGRETVTAPTEVKTTTGGSSSTPVVPSSTTPSSPLLTSLLRSPTASSTGPSGSGTKVSSSPVATKLSFNLTSPSGGMSPGLKNLVSTAIGEETSPVKASIASPVAGAGAPTLTRLLELPLNSPGKPLPELTVAEETAEVSTTVESPVKAEAQPVPNPTTDEEEVKSEEVEEKTELQPEPVVVAPEPIEVVESEVFESPMEEATSTTEPETVEAVHETEPEETAVTSEAEPVVSVFEPTIKEEQEEMNTAVESEVEVSQREEEVEERMDESLVEETVPVVKSEIMEEVEETVIEEVEKTVDEANESNVEEKSEEPESKLVDEEVVPKFENSTPTRGRRPGIRGMRRKGARGGGGHVSSTDGGEEKAKPAEPGPTTRRSSGRERKTTQSEEQEVEPVEETVETSTPSAVVKKKAPPPPLYVPSTSPAASSGIDSTPNSPTSSISTVADDDREYRTWKKSILLVWREICGHKNASLFLKPITEETAPGYKSHILRPMDLSTIKKNIESGAIRSTTEFHREVTLMFFNSMMFNPTNHEIHRLAFEMFTESNVIIKDFVNAQLLAAHNMDSLRPQRRETRDLARRTESLSSHEETPSKPEEGKTRAAKRASAAAQVDDVSSSMKAKRRSRLANE